jgi:hypothetical protein
MRYLLALLLAVALLSATAQPAAAQSAPGEISAYPTAGPAGTRFAFLASGFRSRERVAVWMNTPDGRVVTIEAESLRRATREGRVNWFWSAPEGTQPGFYQMVARGVLSGVERVVTFQIGEPGAEAQPAAEPAERANVYPGEGRPGTLFVFFAIGYAKGESVALWVNRPDGQAQAVEAERVQIDQGRLDFSWIAPGDAPRGNWEMVAVGRESGTQTVIPFVLR